MRHRYQVNAVSVADLGYLLGPPPRSRAIGTLAWTFQKRHEGRCDVEACVSTIEGAFLQLTFPKQRPWAVSLTMIGNSVPLRRVCVNGHQQKVSGPCHMHTYIPATGEETAVALAEFPICPLHVPAKAVPYREMFAAFAALSGVELTGLQWRDPPDLEGGPDEH